MPFHTLSDAEVRTKCKEAIEALEFWLRRVIDIALRYHFGDQYMDAIDPQNGQSIIKKSIREGITQRARRAPDRYPRLIDAALLDDEIDIVCNPKLYKAYFKEFFKTSFPMGNDELRFFLGKIMEPRNNLAHANPIRVRQAEHVICYTHDVIDAVKSHIKELNMEKEYNAPTIIKISDSNGSVFHESQIRRNSTGRGHIEIKQDKSTWLRAGDIISIEVEVDPSYASNEYSVLWTYTNPSPEHSGYRASKIAIKILEEHVNEVFTVYCSVISNKPWHRCGDVDDCVGLTYKILPPV